jgi:hypothetical protein
MNADVLRKYWVELAIAALAVIALLVGLVLTHHGQAPPDTAAAGAPSATDAAASSTTTTATTATATAKTANASLPVLSRGTTFWIERVQHGTTLEHFAAGKPLVFTMKPGETLSIGGWAFDGSAGAPATAVVGQVDSTRTDGVYGMHRPDVGQVFKNPKLDDVGYTIDFPASDFTPGKHTIALLVENAAQTGYYPIHNIAIVTVGK